MSKLPLSRQSADTHKSLRGSTTVSIDQEARLEIVRELIEWYRAHKRDLPWRSGSVYAVWVSEIMLQQTQVVTVIPYFLRFMERFPTLRDLAEAPLDDVLNLWSGLGYYARARNLHRAAKIVLDRFDGVVPRDAVAIQSLPGIGRYTSGAVLSIAYDLPQPLVDANVIRVLSRIFGIEGDPKSASNQSKLWGIAEQLVPAVNAGEFNQGLMELGALVCEPAEPKCDLCPLLARCVSGASDDPARLPDYPPGKATVNVTHVSALISDGLGRFLIVQRPPHGLWGGLWEFPRVVCAVGETPEEAVNRAVHDVAGVEVAGESGLEARATAGRRIAKIQHSVTHHRITLYGYLISSDFRIAEANSASAVNRRWSAPADLGKWAFSSPQVLLRDALLQYLAPSNGGDASLALSFEDAES